MRLPPYRKPFGGLVNHPFLVRSAQQKLEAGMCNGLSHEISYTFLFNRSRSNNKNKFLIGGWWNRGGCWGGDPLKDCWDLFFEAGFDDEETQATWLLPRWCSSPVFTENEVSNFLFIVRYEIYVKQISDISDISYNCAIDVSLSCIVTVYGGFLKWWYPTTMGFPTKNDHFGVWNGGYHHLRKHPYYIEFYSCTGQLQ